MLLRLEEDGSYKILQDNNDITLLSVDIEQQPSRTTFQCPKQYLLSVDTDQQPLKKFLKSLSASVDNDLRIEYPIKKEKTEQFGLKYKPVLPHNCIIRNDIMRSTDPESKSNNANSIDFGHINMVFTSIQNKIFNEPPDRLFFLDQLRVLEKIINKLNSSLESHLIVEIGVDGMGKKLGEQRNYVSMTKLLLSTRSDKVHYVGVDVLDKSYVTRYRHRKGPAHFLQADTFDQNTVRDFISETFNLPKFSFLLIDGSHSVNAVLNDFKYVDMMDDNSIVFLHDTNHHPGPVTLFDAIDENIFCKRKLFENINNCGCALVARKGTDFENFIMSLDEKELKDYSMEALKQDSDFIKSIDYSPGIIERWGRTISERKLKNYLKIHTIV